MNDPNSYRILGVVLAGGRSSRMGSTKALLPHAIGRTYLHHSIDRLSNCCDGDVIVSMATDQTDVVAVLPDSVSALIDERPQLGPAEGVRMALQHAANVGFDACLFTAVDLPDLTSDDLRALIAAWQDSPARITVAVSDDGSLQPLVAIYPVGMSHEIDKVARSQHRSLYRFLKTAKVTEVPIPNQRLRNVNSPDEI